MWVCAGPVCARGMSVRVCVHGLGQCVCCGGHHMDGSLDCGECVVWEHVMYTIDVEVMAAHKASTSTRN